jgi:hypothetical protein
MGGQQKNFISDIVFFQHQDGMQKKVRRHFLQCVVDDFSPSAILQILFWITLQTENYPTQYNQERLPIVVP